MNFTYLTDMKPRPLRLDQVTLLGRLCAGHDYILPLPLGREQLALEAAQQWRCRGKRVLLVAQSPVAVGALLQTAFSRGAHKERLGSTPLAVTNWESLWRARCAGESLQHQFDVLLLVNDTAIGVMTGI